LLRLPYLQKQHGTFEVYWKKYEPPKLVEPPKVIEVLPRVPSLPSRHRKCVSCGKDFYVPFGQFPTPFDCPVCRSKPLETNRGRRSQAHLHLFCQQCWKEFDVPFGQFSPPRYCPECKSKSPWLK
jgi:DNA-directed RNA polymerase subunit RPC12/RpoP